MRNKVTFVVICIVVFLAGATGAFFVAKQLSNKKQPVATADTSMAVSSAQGAIDAIKQAPPASIAGLSAQTGTNNSAVISGFLPNNNTVVRLAAGASVLYEAATDSTKISSDDLLNEAGSILTNGGLSQRKTALSTAGTALYANDTVSCQIQVAQATLATVLFACADVTELVKEYETLKTLVGLYNTANTATPIDISTIQSIGRTSKSKDTIVGSIVSIANTSQTDKVATGSVLLFGAIGGKWEYIANLSEGKSVGKVNLTAENLVKVNDKKWNGVLAGLVGV